MRRFREIRETKEERRFENCRLAQQIAQQEQKKISEEAQRAFDRLMEDDDLPENPSYNFN